LLYNELALRSKKRNANEKYVFPEQAAMYQENPDGITWRVRKVLAAAGFRDDEASEKESTGENGAGQKSIALVSQSDQNSEAPSSRGEIHVARKEGLRRASVRDFHSFRVTWVTLALTAGVPLELVQKVTGHKTAEIVLKHYFQPGREAFRQALQMAMPKLLTNGQKSPKEEMVEILKKMTAKTWKKNKVRLEEILKAF